MSDKSIDQLLQRYFPDSQNNDWEKIAGTEIKAQGPLQRLAWTGKDGNFFLPYYHAADVSGIGYGKYFYLRPGHDPLQGARAWSNMPGLHVGQEKEANKIALRLLVAGADGILFDLREKNDAFPDALLDQITWPYCHVSFITGAPAFAAQLAEYIRKHFDPAVLQGGLFWESLPGINDVQFLLRECAKFSSLGWVVPTGTPAGEIADALHAGVKIFETVPVADAGRAFRAISFSLSAGADLTETIAKFRALRMLWFQVAQAYGHNDYMPDDLHLHARVAAHSPDPESLVSATFAAMAAVMGGCNALTVDAPQNSASFLRLASNISAILREESFFHREADPIAGAYAVEAIIDALAQQAWKSFQQKWEAS